MHRRCSLLLLFLQVSRSSDDLSSAAAASSSPCSSSARFARGVAALVSAGWPSPAAVTLVPGEAASLRDGYTAWLSADGSSLTLTAASCAGAANGAHRLAAAAAACGGASRACFLSQAGAAGAADAQGGGAVLRDVPVFEKRFYSDQGQLLDAPDRGYWSSPDGGARGLNASRVAADVATVLDLVPMLQAHAFNAFMWEASGIEDFISYDRLGGGEEIYPAGDAHRARADAWQSALAPLAATLASEGLDPYLMLFDLQYPPQLAARYNVSSVRSPDLPRVLTARFRELFERLPALAGVLVYVIDSWAPRAGYNFGQLWSGVEEMAATATLYYDALAAAAPGKQLIFSLWIPTTPLEDAWAVFRNGTPANLTVMVNDGQGDFLWSHGINDVLARGAARDRRLAVASDAFRQYDGQGRLLSSPAQQWAQRLRVAANTSAWAGMCFAEWSPGNTWPDSVDAPAGQLLNWTAAGGYKSWAGLWDRYRISQLPARTGLFSPAEANVAVLAQLFWQPAQEPLTLTAAWARGAPLRLAPLAADLLAAAYNASGDGWQAKYLPDVDEYAVEWSTVFSPKYAPNAESTGAGLLSLFSNATLPALLAANARLAAAFASTQALVQQALAANGTAGAAALALAAAAAPAPLSNAAVAAAARAGAPGALGAALLLAAAKTAAHGAIFADFRAAAWLNASLASGAAPRGEACAALAAALDALDAAVPAFGAAYPEESAAWNVASADPNLDVRPDFFRLEQRTHADWLPLLRASCSAACGGCGGAPRADRAGF